MSQFLTIGNNKGTPTTICDNVYIGSGVCIVEDVKIGNNVKIGQGQSWFMMYPTMPRPLAIRIE